MSGSAIPPVEVPQLITVEWVTELQRRMLESTNHGVTALKALLPKEVAIAILERAERVVGKEAPLLEVMPPTPQTSVVVVGDSHGQYHDVCNMLKIAGPPSEDRMFIFNGDFVDRGAWGMETLILLCCWKLALPRHVFLLRGNHESATCAILYGFKGEVEAKYGKTMWKSVFAMCKKLFAALPLAAVVNRRTLVLHGGLFRKQPVRASGKNKRKHLEPDYVLGNLDDLRKASKGGLDPSGLGASRLATDVQWSDPANEPGFVENVGRGIGMVFGPEITEQFLRENELKLILRSHEGPDAREEREGMGKMMEGYSLDHVTPSGKLMTVFSAPDYPQFMAEDAQRYKNKASVAILSGPDFDEPNMVQYEAVLPRPAATPYYDLFVNDSDEEFEPAPPTASGMTDVREEVAEAAAAGEVASRMSQDEHAEPAVKDAANRDSQEGPQANGAHPDAREEPEREPSSNGHQSNGKLAREAAPVRSAETPAVRESVPADQVENHKGRRPQLPRPTGIQPCPRCASEETKFCYYNNYNIKQPRYYCKACQRYWTAGGTLRDVPVGAGRRRHKPSRSQDGLESLSGGLAPVPLASMMNPNIGMDPALAAMGMAPQMMQGLIPGMSMPPGAMMPPMSQMPPVGFSPDGMHPGMMGIPMMGESLTKATANGLLPDPAMYAGLPGASAYRPTGAVSQPTEGTVSRLSGGAAEDGAVEGRRTRQRTTDGVQQAQQQQQAQLNHLAPHADALTATGAPSHAQLPPNGVMPNGAGMTPYAIEWFQANPQAAAVMQAQFHAAASGQYGGWYGGFPSAWGGAGYPGSPGAGGGGFPPSNGIKPPEQEGSTAGQGPEQQPHQAFTTAPLSMPVAQMAPGMPWGGAMPGQFPGQWPMQFQMPMPPQVAVPAGVLPLPMPVSAGAAAATGALPGSRTLGHMVPNATEDGGGGGGA